MGLVCPLGSRQKKSYFLEAYMSVAEIYEKRATFSFEVFPPKTAGGMEKLCGKDGVLE